MVKLATTKYKKIDETILNLKVLARLKFFT